MDPLLVAYVTFTFVLVATPGSTTAVVVRNTLIGGRPAGLAAAFGAATGNTTHAAAAGLGLAVIFSRWPVLLTGLRVAGAVYLAWLGCRSLYRVVRHADGGLTMVNDAHAASDVRAHAGSFRQGLTVNLLNPAIATFYLVVVPSFVPATAPAGYFATLAAVHVLMALLFHGLWAFGLARIRQALQPPMARRLLEGATGVALIALAMRVASR